MMRKKIALLGANVDTGNLGVNALAISTIQIVSKKFPGADIVLFGSGRHYKTSILKIDGKNVQVENLPVRLSPNVLVKHHYFKYIFGGLIDHFPFWVKQKNIDYQKIKSIDMFLDITGGDSFSDIYGFKRFFLMYFIKLLALAQKKPFVMLPQTYGPFIKKISKYLAINILKRSSLIFCRDKQDVSYVKKLLDRKGNTDIVKYCPDVAFVLQKEKYTPDIITELENIKKRGNKVIGLNISGLLYLQDVLKEGLSCFNFSYYEFIVELIPFLNNLSKDKIVLIPHVISKYENSPTKNNECDLAATIKIVNENPSLKKMVIINDDKSITESQVKYLISKCDFFLGSRMHSTIAAISQKIPVVGLAYSKKFFGIFNSVDVGDLVIELNQVDRNIIFDRIRNNFNNLDEIRNKLDKTVQSIISEVWNIPISSLIEGVIDEK